MPVTTMKESVKNWSEDSRQFLVFSLGPEEYGIEIHHVQEIKGLADVTPLPNSPNHVKGVLNLRGTVIPIIDLRQRFEMDEREYDRFTVIIVIAIEGKSTGLVVDRVSDVLSVPTEQIDDAPPVAHGLAPSAFRGVAKLERRLVFLLDVTELIGTENAEQMATGSSVEC